MRVYLGADHRGLNLKERIKETLQKRGYRVTDCGALQFNAEDDYPHYAKRVAGEIAKHPQCRGVLVCGSGIGMAIAANRFRRVRAGLCADEKVARAGRNDDDMNVLVLESDFTNERTAIRIVSVFLKTAFAKKTRYLRRIREIDGPIRDA